VPGDKLELKPGPGRLGYEDALPSWPKKLARVENTGGALLISLDYVAGCQPFASGRQWHTAAMALVVLQAISVGGHESIDTANASWSAQRGFTR